MKTVLVCALGVIVVFCAAVSFATVYEVGPGKPYTNIRDVPWESIAAGDTVNIYYKATPYNDKFDVTVAGTQSQPVLIHGVPDVNGNLPVLDGDGAVERSQPVYTTDDRGIINIGYGQNHPTGFVTTYVTIENLEVRHARAPYTFTRYNGSTVNFGSQSNGLYAAVAENITINNCIFDDNSEGVFFSSNSLGTTKYMTLQGCYLYNNGLASSGTVHNSYCESMGITYQYNRYGQLAAGSVGNNLKDRSSNMVIRYNWIDSGDRLMDLVDAEDSTIIRSDPNYNKAFVYGNVLLKNTVSGQTGKVLHFGYDGKASYSRTGPLQFYNNTFVSYLTGPAYLIRGSSSSVTTDCYNNILFVTAAGSNLQIGYNAGTVNLSHNFMKPGWVNGAGTINNDGTQVTGSDAGWVDFANQDFHLAAGSLCVNAGKALPAVDLPDNNVVRQYVKHLSSEARPSDGVFDIGAYELASGPPANLVITTTSLPAGTVGVAYSATLTATGGVPAYTWAISVGSLPNGLSLAPSTGVISGTPTGTGTAFFTALVTDSQQPPDSDSKALSITVNAAPPAPTITTTSLPNGTRGVAYSQTVQATGGTLPYAWSVVSGSLPNGLTLNSSTGVISGTPSRRGTYNFTVRCTDALSQYDEQALTIIIN
jgi:hypothetical protein